MFKLENREIQLLILAIISGLLIGQEIVNALR